ncbi:MAG TPA: hypothetical protein VK306_03440 [Acidimicrobiales bacterium]|nr:hypothetical protein [Acidimicrobiales bacterium]
MIDTLPVWDGQQVGVVVDRRRIDAVVLHQRGRGAAGGSALISTPEVLR